MLSRYKEWVKRHPGVVQNLDWLLLLAVWNPSRTSGGSEFSYEAYHAAVGLLSLWHQNILEEEELATSRPPPYLWLDAIEYVETLIELRGMHLESVGKMSRYAPLVVVETVKAILKMAAWSRYSGHMFLRRPSPDDLHQFESEVGLQDIRASLERLRLKYTTGEAPAQGQPSPVPCHRVPAAAAAAAAVDVAAPQASTSSTAPAATAAAATGSATAPVVGGGCTGARCAAASGNEPAAAAATDSGATGGAMCPVCGGWTGGSGGSRGSGRDGRSCARNGESYGVREYAAEWLGGWVLARAPGRTTEGGGDSKSSNGSGSCGAGGGSEGGSSSGRGEQQQQQAGPRPSSSDFCCHASADDASCEEITPFREDAEGPERPPRASSSSSPLPPPPPPGIRCCCCGGSSASSSSNNTSVGPVPQNKDEQPQLGVGLWGQGTAAAGPVVTGPNTSEDPDVHMGRNLLWLAELLHIWRPVLYVSLLKRYGRCSWRPWLSSLAVDLLSGHFHRRGRQHVEVAEARAAAARAARMMADADASDAAAAGATSEAEAGAKGMGGGMGAGPAATVPPRPPPGAGTSLLSLALGRSLAAPGITAGEEREVYERRRKLALYALRSPFLEVTSLSWLSALRNATRRIPLVGFGADYLYGLVDTFTAYYSYTSGSN